MTNTPKLINEPDFLVDGFYRLDKNLLEPKAPRITFLKGFYTRTSEQQIEYLIKLASTMNHAAKLIQDERNQLIALLIKKDEQLKKASEALQKNNEMLQHEISRMNEERQIHNIEVARLKQELRELNRNDNS